MTEKADYLLTNAIVLTMDEELNQYDPGALAISGESILAAGPEDEIKQSFKADEIIDCEGKVVMPGLINAHTHVPMTLLRGLADDLRLDVWLMGYMMPVEREFVSPDFVRLGTQIACVEMIRNGVTSFADMYYYEEEVAKATAEIGLRAVCSQTVLKFPPPDAQSFEESLAAAEDFIQNWKDHPLIIPSVAPHSPYTCTENWLPNTMSHCTRTSLKPKLKLRIHAPITACQSSLTSKRRTFLMPRCWPLIVYTSMSEKCIPSTTTARVWPTVLLLT
jgi:5-methylthioadenosine/S-adenosylhomocysteine deaminase